MKAFIYDTPLRVFHWIFAVLFITAFAIGKTIDDEELLFSYHMLAGMVLSFSVVLRLLWGFMGSKYSRFSSFDLNPRGLINYLSGIFKNDKRLWAGHNPASSWAAIVMFTLALGLGFTGYLMGRGYKEQLEDIHELMANTFLVVVLLHIAGVLIHGWRHRDQIALSMVSGYKNKISTDQGVQRPYRYIAVLFLVLVFGFSAYLVNNFDKDTRTLNLMGQSLNLGEEEHHY